MSDEAMSDDEPTAEATGDVNDQFREALERKRTKKHPHEADGHGDSKIHGTHSASGGKREFRRKSGG